MQVVPKKNVLHDGKFLRAGAVVDLSEASAIALIDGGYAVKVGADATYQPAKPQKLQKQKAKAKSRAAEQAVFDPTAALGPMPTAE